MNEKVNNIIDFFVTQRRVDTESVKGDCTLRDVCITRYMIYAYLHNKLNLPTRQIGQVFGRTRINVLRGIRVLKGWMRYHDEIRSEYFSIVEKIEGAV